MERNRTISWVLSVPKALHRGNPMAGQGAQNAQPDDSPHPWSEPFGTLGRAAWSLQRSHSLYQGPHIFPSDGKVPQSYRSNYWLYASGKESDLKFDHPKCKNCTAKAVSEFTVEYDESVAYFGSDQECIGVLDTLRFDENLGGQINVEVCHGPSLDDDKAPAMSHGSSLDDKAPVTTPAAPPAATSIPKLPTVAIGKHDLSFESYSIQDLGALADAKLIWDVRGEGADMQQRERG